MKSAKRIQWSFFLLSFCAAFYAPFSHADDWQLVFERASADILGNPHDIALDKSGKRLLVSDVNNHRITVLDSDTLEVIGSFGDGELSSPHDVEIGPGGKIYVADTGNNRIAIYECDHETDGVDARLVDELKGRIRAPEGVAVTQKGQVYATGAWSGNVVLFDPSGEVLIEKSGFSGPHDLALDVNGNVWLADANNNRMVKLTQELEVIKLLEGAPYDFNGPRYMDIDGDDNLLIADKYAHQIKIVSPDGELLLVVGSGEAEKGENLFTTPEGVELRDDIIWFSDSGNNRVVRYRKKLH